MNRSISYLALLVLAFLLFVYVFTDVFAYIVIALVITAILSPVIEKMTSLRVNQYHIPRIVAVFFSYGLLSLIIYLFFLLFMPLLSEQLNILREMEHSSASADLTVFEDYLISSGLVDEEPGFITNWVVHNKERFLSRLDISNVLNEIFSITGTFFVGLLAVSFFSFFFLSDKTLVERLVLGFIPNRFFEIAITIYSKIKLLLGSYLVGLVVQMVLIFTFVSIGLSVVGVNYAFTIALFTAIANLIPYVGPWIGAIFGLWVSISTGADISGELNLSSWAIFRIVIVYGAVQILDNILFQPLIFSKSVKAHPLEIFVIIFAGGILFGPVGMVMAIPGYTLLKVFVTEVYFGVKRYRIFQK